MSIRIPLIYLEALQKAVPKHSDWVSNPILMRLNSELHTVPTLDRLIELFYEILYPQPVNNNDENKFFYGPVAVYTQVTKWLDQLVCIRNLHAVALEKIAALKTNNPDYTFLHFLSVLLEEKETLLHVDVMSFLTIINKKSFEKIIEYLYQKSDSPKLESTRRGSFLTIDVQDDIFLTEAICLFNNLVAQFDEKNQHFEIANSLMQNAIKIYHDLIMFPTFYDIPLDDTITFMATSSEKSTEDKEDKNCVIS